MSADNHSVIDIKDIKEKDLESFDGTTGLFTIPSLGAELGKPASIAHASAEVQEDEAPKSTELPPVALLDLYRYATRKEAWLNIFGLFMAAAAGAAQPLMSLLFGNLTQSFVDFGKDAAIAFGPDGTLADLEVFDAARDSFKSAASRDASYLVVIGIAMFVATYAYMYIWVRNGETNAKRVREEYLRAILRQDISYFDSVGTGEVTSRIQTDTHLIQQGVSEKVALAVSYLGSFFAGFILAYVRSWKLSLALTSILPCITISGAVMNGFVAFYMQLSLKHVAEGGSFAEEVFSSIRTAQAFGTQEKLATLYDVRVNNSYQSEAKKAVFQGVGLGLFFFIIYSAYGLCFSFGTTLIISGEVNAGIVVNVFLSILTGSFSLAMLAPELQAISYARAAAAKLFATIDRVPTIDSSSKLGYKRDKVYGEITVRNVDFHYPARPDVQILKNLSITFPAGQTSALVGASGSGKSTIVSLVERFYDPISGAVELDGIDLKELNVRWLRSQIGLVSQEPTLFATTIRGNVEQGLVGSQHENASDFEKASLIKQACIKANADGFISKLPNGYDTMVGERGFLLSGGQKQRIAIARAIVADPAILLLDEATSALDTQSEGIVQDALDKASAGRTTITIAHRLSTIKNAHRIFVMGQGMVLEAGTHDELLQNEDGAYTRLVSAQRLREKEVHEEDEDMNEAQKQVEELLRQQNAEKAERADRIRRRASGMSRLSAARSVSSAIIERLRGEGRFGESSRQEYGFFYLFRRMGLLNRESWTLYSFATIAAILTGLIYPSFGVVYAKAIESFQLTDHHALRHAGDRNALYFFLIALASTVTIGFQNYLFSKAAARLTQIVRSLTFRSILRQDVAWFDEDKNSTGALTSTLADAPLKINGLAGITLGAIIQAASTLVGGSIVGLVFGWKLAFVSIACMPFLVGTGYVRLKVVVLKDQKNRAAYEESAQVACEAAGAIRTVASLTREDLATKEYSDSLEIPLIVSRQSAVWSTALFALSQAMSFFIIALVFWYGSRLVASGEMDIFHFFVCLMSVTFGAIQAGNVFTFVPDISSAKAAATTIVNLIDSVPEIDAQSTEGEKVGKVNGEIRFHKVHFRYPTRPGVRLLRSLNLVVAPGTYVALVGASGSGKSTVIQLLERFYDPLAGTITLDGKDIAQLNVQDYRKEIALVSQEPTLYAGTILFNILLGATKPFDQVTQEEVEAACRDANILEFIQSLPDGFETQVGGKGTQLSGGQKQRIAIARALVRNPKVLLLDEATSALDAQSEKVVQEALDNAARGRTTIAIAHRLASIQNADCIYFLKDGRIAESGTHDELLAKKGGYHELVQLQALSKKN
ncbi:hypothetical protein BOTBODRAFT_181275 [Botryobasidium botryosum FD-172 SS1]|uniref:P-loop containing nucleoside triphosphate hydrolase protein n=1 Tax=Botryobasidium botryosum (strain FD-172 SS1) TaxID=930990 RepID=A0A067M4P5_BOTB1|nr:hypothetical protein BOTBODRAFT_181275 [Botryobasidium botryosum FD-172 SS1]